MLQSSRRYNGGSTDIDGNSGKPSVGGRIGGGCPKCSAAPRDCRCGIAGPCGNPVVGGDWECEMHGRLQIAHNSVDSGSGTGRARGSASLLVRLVDVPYRGGITKGGGGGVFARGASRLRGLQAGGGGGGGNGNQNRHLEGGDEGDPELISVPESTPSQRWLEIRQLQPQVSSASYIRSSKIRT